MKHDLAFLHTANTHADTFQCLIDELAPDICVNHVVNENLLQDAITEGEISTALQARIETTMHEAAATGSRVVVCTCSTIGGIAENMTSQPFVPMRIDRAMANTAVKSGKYILLAATVDSTHAPTRNLLETSAQKAGVEIEIHDLLIDRAWQAFQKGDLARYFEMIAKEITANTSSMDCVVLAQASMAPAVDQCRDIGIPILSSPRLGVMRALELFDQTKSQNYSDTR